MELNDSLSEARSEIKTLTTKLAAARNAEANIKVPGSALKPNAAANRGPPTEIVQAAQAKEDLYGDLTGLLIRGMKPGENEDVFDCIQTKQNRCKWTGQSSVKYRVLLTNFKALHFKLALDKPEECENYEDVQYTYRPQLDPNRDGDLLDILPDYLVEEITFPRTHAAKFYTRVIKSLME